MDCECPGPGFCPRYQIEQQEYPHAVCQGKHGEAIQLRYQAKWARLAGLPRPAIPPRPPRPPEPEPAGPGTELRNLLKAAGIDLAGCSCNKRVRVMNAMGAEWCRERRDVIVGWLREVADRDGWPKINLPAILDAALGSSP